MVKALKILVIGEGAVGKTSIATRYTTGAFKESHLMTLGANFMLKDLKLDGGESIRLSIWDTAGQERFRKIVESYYKGAQGVIITYDITRKTSFDEINYWRNTTVSKVPNAKIVLVGNKADLADEKREVLKEDAEKLAKEWGVPIFESSAKFNTNINEIFMTITNNILEKS